MNRSLRHTSTALAVAIAACAAPVFAQNAAPKAAAPAATTATYGTAAPTPVDRQAARRKKEQGLLGAPREYGTPGAGNDTADAQQADLLDEQRMRVGGGGAQGGGMPAPGKAARNNKAPADAPKAGDNLMAAGAAKSTYADPYGTTGAGKRAVYRSPW
ncbi:hypothetical protein PQQ51_11240 [Paraburkholderia xenovorans]|uniref:hypothetical protein n=1 Tax=Paraburkholderia xenovorans TaxID=36873 RepID=UPI0038B9B24C